MPCSQGVASDQKRAANFDASTWNGHSHWYSISFSSRRSALNRPRADINILGIAWTLSGCPRLSPNISSTWRTVLSGALGTFHAWPVEIAGPNRRRLDPASVVGFLPHPRELGSGRRLAAVVSEGQILRHRHRYRPVHIAVVHEHEPGSGRCGAGQHASHHRGPFLRPALVTQPDAAVDDVSTGTSSRRLFGIADVGGNKFPPLRRCCPAAACNDSGLDSVGHQAFDQGEPDWASAKHHCTFIAHQFAASNGNPVDPSWRGAIASALRSTVGGPHRP